MGKLAKALTAAAGNAAGESLYVEDVFSTYLYTGNSANQTIINGIDLAGEGGLVWTKRRDNSQSYGLFDTERGVLKYIRSDTTDAETTASNTLKAFNSDGFQLGGVSFPVSNSNGEKGVSWTFRKAEKFFDVVTYTGNGNSGYRQISHNLGSTPAAVIQKNITDVKNWYVYHKDTAQPSDTDYATHGAYLRLNTTAAKAFSNSAFPKVGTSSGGVTAVYDSSVFTIGEDLNASGKTYVLYLFASDAGGFGDDGSENIIKCGSFTTNASGNAVVSNLGFEPSWLMIKRSSGAGNWEIRDDMRGFGPGASVDLKANVSDAESSPEVNKVFATATGFDANVSSSSDYIYIAIRRPMKTPEAGTEVFAPVAYSGNSTAGRSITSGFPLDVVLTKGRNAAIEPILYSRLQGSAKKLLPYSTAAEANSSTNVITSFDQDGMTVGTDTDINNSAYTYIDYFFKRATGFMDAVAYTGTGSGHTIAHNLGVAPSMVIIKRRDQSGYSWITWHSGYSVYSNPPTNAYMRLNSDAAVVNDSTLFNSTLPTESVFSVGTSSETNQNNGEYIAYLFGELDGISKFGTYTGTGANIDIDCGFTAGARFILIKRLTPGSGDWFVFDTARGIVAGDDPYFYLNSSAAENTGDYIDPLASGFTITSGGFWINIDTYKYMYWAIA